MTQQNRIPLEEDDFQIIDEYSDLDKKIDEVRLSFLKYGERKDAEQLKQQILNDAKIVDEIRKQIDERIKYTENEIEEFHEPLGEELSWLKKLQSIIEGEK